MNKIELFELIQRMAIDEKVTSSDQSVSFKAHRDAEQINDKDIYKELKDIISANSGKKNKKVRDSAYFIFGKLLKNNFDPNEAAYFIDCINNEDDKYILSSMLDLICELKLPDEIDISPIINCVKNEKWLIRHSAILALGASSTKESREVLTSILEEEDEKKYKYEITYASAALGKIGNKEDIPYLEMHMNSRIQDIKISSRFAIENINSSSNIM